MKIIIAVILVAIIAALTLAGRAMLGKGGSEADKKGRMARALTLRVALSIGLFAFIWFSHYMGWIQPTGIALAPR